MSEKRAFSEINVERFESEPSIAVGSFFKGVRVPKRTKFELYRNKKSADKYMIHGENDRIEYSGSTDDDSSASSQYVVGIYDPSKRSVQLYKAPVIATKVASKSKKDLSGPEIKQNNLRASALRNALGEAFGTKKAKKAIADIERNRIDSDKLVEAAVDIVDSVKTASKDLPTRQELQQVSSQDRTTPQANVDATDVEQIYPIHNIIPKKEWQFIRVGPVLKETDDQKRLELFPFTKSQYVSKKLPTLTQAAQMTKLQLLYYVSLLLGVYENRRVSDKAKLLEHLNAPPEVLVDGILDRFTIVRPGQYGRSKERGFFIDPQREDKLLCYILAIILHLDNFIVEISPLAQELGLKPSKIVNLFKNLGAIVKGATVSQAEAFGIPKSAASTYKIATMKVPFKIPEMSRRSGVPRR
ncbi:DNA-directed RNA polymerase I subunit RPA49 [Lachancea thermotolerans CBS 6340]|uniref:KLTH0F03102p n=1 Tax=Lachancea thermotolerans (strain ATCC 56472 / CBS 6340 / NRRL Y-8284) TaxID=559295 RepID=C5DKA8_LACTC|nr:KLTH0F03102p [Lachancea thermotolerans CBS 6340]CAR23909.1 KLTH0F03102p [Lachancea thermotolerans CBS 6340]